MPNGFFIFLHHFTIIEVDNAGCHVKNFCQGRQMVFQILPISRGIHPSGRAAFEEFSLETHANAGPPWENVSGDSRWHNGCSLGALVCTDAHFPVAQDTQMIRKALITRWLASALALTLT